MNYQCITISLFLVSLQGVPVFSGEDLSGLIESALERAGDNAVSLQKALEDAPQNQKEGIRFLIAYMPDHDLKSLSAEFLLNQIRFAYQAWNEVLWKDRIPKEIFLNDVLPYASINERRDDWRQDFYERFKPLVADMDSPGRAAAVLNQKIFSMLQVKFSRGRPKADQSPYETIQAGMASCTGLSVVLVDACRAVGIPARFAGTPQWADRSGNHSWVEIWDGKWHYMGAAEPAGEELDQAWFTDRAATALKDSRLHAIYAASYQPTGVKFPLVWDRRADYVHAVNVTERYTKPQKREGEQAPSTGSRKPFDMEASLHAVAQLEAYLKTARNERLALGEQGFAAVALTREHAKKAEQLLWDDHVQKIKQTRAEEMEARLLKAGDLQMPFYYTVSGDKPDSGRSLFISLHGGGSAPKRVNDRQWENQKRLYQVDEGVYLAPRAPTDSWNMWHQAHMDGLLDRLIENLIVFEDVNPNRVYLLGYSAGGDGVYQLAPRMADRLAAAAMMAGHPNEASPLGLRNIAFSIHAGGKDSAYNRNEVARQWGQKLDDLQRDDPDGYVHWTNIYENKGHWLDGEDAAALSWMAGYTRNPLPNRIVWRQDDVTHSRFYWLAIHEQERHAGAVVIAEVKGQQFTIQADGIRQLIIRVNDRMLDMDENVMVMLQGKELYRGVIPRSIGILAGTLSERGDPATVFSGEITVAMPNPK
ncbi:MAG: hypothetical protein JW828_00060 [Sedimentisphaerales bacterium]|nr:hypothetical protein [Sedimentisphaerales bacterium]